MPNQLITLPQIPVFKPLIEKEELKACADALEMGWLGMGKYVGEFEKALKSLIEADDRYIAAVSTGHAALHLGLLVAGIGPGNEVITPAFNNIADFQAILATGAEPVFCDISDTSLCIDLAKAEQLVSPRTKAIVVMDYDCMLCDHDAVADFARHFNIRVIHDAAHALGSKYKGKMVGSFSDITVFSFDPVKTVTCVDGGALVVRTEDELRAIHEMRLIGMGQPTSVMYENRRAWTYDTERLGFRYHMSNLHAALGLAQLSKFDLISTRRRKACIFYNQALADIVQVRTPATDFTDVTPFLYYIRVPQDHRNNLRSYLSENGIDTGIHWQPGHWFSLLKDCKRGNLEVTDAVGKEIISLPLYSEITPETQQRIAGSIRTYFSTYG